MANKISVVIPTFNRKNFLYRLLRQLQNQVLYNNYEMLFIIVVDGSTDGTLEMLETEFPNAYIVKGNGNWWWTRSINEGCKLSVKNGADTILLLNDDIKFDQNYIENLLKSIGKEPNAIIGSLNITEEKEKRIYFSGAKKLRWWDGKLEKYHQFLTLYNKNMSGLHDSIVLPGRGLSIPVNVFKKIGYFDEKRFPQYKADYDFVLRANKKGIKTLISWDSIIYSHVKTTGDGATFTKQSLFNFSLSLFKKNSRTNIYRNFLYYKRHLPLWNFPIFPLTVLIILTRQFFLFFKNKKY